MKVAVCLYGYPRNFEQGYKALTYFLDGIDHDFFMHFWCDVNTNDDGFNQIYDELNLLYNPVNFTLERQIEFKNSFNFECDLSSLKQEFVNSGNAISISLSPLYSIKKVGELIEKSKNKYDLVILTRSDVLCTKKLNELSLTNFDKIYSSFCHGEIWNLNVQGEAIDTKMIFSSQESMEYFFKIYDNVEKYIEHDKIKLCHHRLFAHHLKKLNKPFEMVFPGLDNWFYIRSNNHLEGEIVHSNCKEYKNIFN